MAQNTTLSEVVAFSDPVLSMAFLFIAFMAGAVWASFSCLVAARIHRIDHGERLLSIISYPPSHCDGCDTPLSPKALIPVFGWLAMRGRCSTCSTRVSPAYPLYELIIGLAAVAAIFVGNGDPLTTIALVGAVLVAGLAAAIDRVQHVIPEELTWMLLFCGLLLSPFADLESKVLASVLACGMTWLALAVSAEMTREDTRAGGDVAMAAGCAAWFSIETIPVFLFVSCLIFAALNALDARAGKRWTPMGPAIALAFLLVTIGHYGGYLPEIIDQSIGSIN